MMCWFYKGGCQEKRLWRERGEGIFLDIPALFPEAASVWVEALSVLRSFAQSVAAAGAVGKRESRSDFRGGAATGFSIAGSASPGWIGSAFS
jgi:hypothetical protein